MKNLSKKISIIFGLFIFTIIYMSAVVEDKKRPMFGSSLSCGDCIHVGYNEDGTPNGNGDFRVCEETIYVFWIGFPNGIRTVPC